MFYLHAKLNFTKTFNGTSLNFIRYFCTQKHHADKHLHEEY
jgi:hypothetical protein